MAYLRRLIPTVLLFAGMGLVPHASSAADLKFLVQGSSRINTILLVFDDGAAFLFDTSRLRQKPPNLCSSNNLPALALTGFPFSAIAAGHHPDLKLGAEVVKRFASLASTEPSGYEVEVVSRVDGATNCYFAVAPTEAAEIKKLKLLGGYNVAVHVTPKSDDLQKTRHWLQHEVFGPILENW